MRGEDYRGRGGGVGKGLLAPVLGMKDIINIMGVGGGDPISKCIPSKLSFGGFFCSLSESWLLRSSDF